MQPVPSGQSEIAVVSYALASTDAFAGPHSTMLSSNKKLKYVIFDDARRYMWRPNLHHIFHPTEEPSYPTGLLLDDFHTRPPTLAELFTLAVLANNGPPSDDGEEDGVLLQAHIMEALDPFDFSEAVVDRLLRPQLMAAVRHAMCAAN